ncbi:MAG: hypothetical protein Hyperionvirus10_35 [Hyperionvirus sp.]|uniref:Uncharacterized protein n=1 Tax=Hyperionvirus sp. TaxID=2487770 RepID=A0A3G5AEA1_9VIRU|nr:MAG: hypothetical protein Hyperionvirus10_35 [Hyperionvirus sp.]
MEPNLCETCKEYYPVKNNKCSHCNAVVAHGVENLTLEYLKKTDLLDVNPGVLAKILMLNQDDIFELFAIYNPHFKKFNISDWVGKDLEAGELYATLAGFRDIQPTALFLHDAVWLYNYFNKGTYGEIEHAILPFVIDSWNYNRTKNVRDIEGGVCYYNHSDEEKTWNRRETIGRWKRLGLTWGLLNCDIYPCQCCKKGMKLKDRNIAKCIECFKVVHIGCVKIIKKCPNCSGQIIKGLLQGAALFPIDLSIC